MGMSTSDSPRRDTARRHRDTRQDERHRATVVSAEMRRLEIQLLALGPMPRERLADQCHADRWHEGTFQEAVQQGLRTHRLQELPMGWLKANQPTAAPPSAAAPARRTAPQTARPRSG